MTEPIKGEELPEPRRYLNEVSELLLRTPEIKEVRVFYFELGFNMGDLATSTDEEVRVLALKWRFELTDEQLEELYNLIK